MTKEIMNVHKALCELKILEARIEKGIRDCDFVSNKKILSKMVGALTTEDFKESEAAKYQSVTDLIARKGAIKRAVVLSNATTKVLVGDVEYTVAEAIDLKQHGLDAKMLLREQLSNALRVAERTIEMANNDAERKADEYVKSIAGGKDVKSDEIDLIRKSYLNGLRVELVDAVPGGAREVLKKLDDEINHFMIEVDSVLSTSNALTQITVEY